MWPRSARIPWGQPVHSKKSGWVLVLAEPGSPLPAEKHDPNLDAESMLKSVVRFVPSLLPGTAGEVCTPNARWFLDKLYPSLSFDEQLRRVWITESRAVLSQ